MSPSRGRLRERVEHQRYLLVFLAILAVLVSISFVRSVPHVPVVLLAGLVGIAFGPLHLRSAPGWLKTSFFLLVLLRAVGLWMRTEASILVADLALLTLFTIGTVAILRDVLTQPMVGLDTILGGCSVYLLVGICFAIAFSLTETIEPGSFQIGGRTLDPEYMRRTPQLVYLSFVVLTSVGFGDILPITNPARGLVMVEAIFGQLYLAILVARLVSQYAGRTPGK